VPLPGTGSVAFSVIIAMGAVTGVLSYVFFNQAAPGPLFTPAKFFEPVPEGVPSGTLKEKEGQQVD
jgi:hypothetical protein